jgi:hypothetical protein
VKRNTDITRFTAIFILATAYCIAGEGADISLTGGDVQLTIANGTAGVNPNPATNSNCALVWTSEVADPTQKITVESNVVAPHFALKVQATGVSGGASAGFVTIGNAADVITNILSNTASGGATLSYQASVTAGDGTGSDLHLITYTITAQ